MTIQLRIPGPTPLPEAVCASLSKQMINHRSREFETLFLGVSKKLQTVFQTTADVLIFPGSGTGGLEASIVNLFSPGQTVLAVVVGSFGQRFADIAEAFGLKVIRQEFPAGKAADPNEMESLIRQYQKIVGVLVTHNETSTGVTNPIAHIAKVVKNQHKLLLVDAVSSLGAIDLPVDRLGIDVAITASQKAWMSPPGLTMLSVSKTAWKAHENAKLPHYYWDFSRAKKYLAKGQTPYTPALTALYALDTALTLMLREGMANVFARHNTLGQRLRTNIKALGLSLFADEAYASNTVTAINVPHYIGAKDLLAKLRKLGIIVASGQDSLKDKIFRIAHMGHISESDIAEITQALKTDLYFENLGIKQFVD